MRYLVTGGAALAGGIGMHYLKKPMLEKLEGFIDKKYKPYFYKIYTTYNRLLWEQMLKKKLPKKFAMM